MKLFPALGVIACGLAASWAQTPQPSDAVRVNEVFGIPLFPEQGTLWEEDADVVARRLGLHAESQTADDASYRLYPPDDARVLGRRPHAISLSAQNGKVAALNIIFANKGDSVGQFTAGSPAKRAPRPEQVLRDYRKAITEDDKALDGVLESLAGPSAAERSGSSGKMQERARRRDWNGHALLLVSLRDEYVALRIVPTRDLDEAGAGGRLPVRELREKLSACVQRRDNGDVVISGIPMLDQGPKGFCVPATMERMLRHLGIPADMYILAMAANTQPGGGTTVEDVTFAVSDAVRRNARRVINVSGRPDPSNIAKWIDDGIPVLWALRTSESVNEQINERTLARQNVTEWKQWADAVKQERRDARKLAKDAGERHVCLITGYNRATGEIALSDSWGPAYEERWITAEEADALSQGAMAVVSW